MHARPLLPILGAFALACAAAVWIALERAAPPAAPVERLELPAPTIRSGPRRVRVEQREPMSQREATGAGAERAPELEQEPERSERDPLVVGAVPRPEPGTRSGPLATEFYENGQMMYEAHQRQLADGSWVLDGPWTSWHENGELQEQGAYRDEREHGRWQWWAANGQSVAVGGFLDGAREGAWSFWHEDGVRLMDATYSNGEGAGRWTMYHESGQRAAEGEYRDGQISGYWTVWDEFGLIDTERSGTYERGVRIGD